MHLFLERISCIIVAGGLKRGPRLGVEVFSSNFEIKQLPNLPDVIDGSSMVVHNGIILLCGGWHNGENRLQLEEGTWKVHSNLNIRRYRHSAQL